MAKNSPERFSIEWYERQIPIDRLNLVDELPKHAQLLAGVMREATFTKYEAEALKEDVDKAEAIFSLKLRREITEGGLKITVDEIKSRIILNPRVQDAKRKLLEAQQLAARWQALADAFRHRGYALRELVELLVHEMMDDPGTIASGRARRRLERKSRSPKD